MRTVQLLNLVLDKMPESASNTGNDALPQENETDVGAYSIQNQARETEMSTEKILFLFWLSGALALTAYHLTAYWKMRRKVRRWSFECKKEAMQNTAAISIKNY